VTHLAILDELEVVKQVEPLFPGLPAASYPSDDMLEESDELDVLYRQRKRYNREYGFCLFTAECVVTLAALCKGKKVLEAGSGSGWLAQQLAQRE
jgi:2-polyprenyl-3-methyl-5-hydroxy-6-metoxy-1,4-benzoquinol methylase